MLGIFDAKYVFKQNELHFVSSLEGFDDLEIEKWQAVARVICHRGRVSPREPLTWWAADHTDGSAGFDEPVEMGQNPSWLKLN